MLLLSFFSSFVSPHLPLGLGFLLPRGFVRGLRFAELVSLVCSYTPYDVTGTRIPRCVPPWPGCTYCSKCTERWLPRASSFQPLREGTPGRHLHGFVFGARVGTELSTKWLARGPSSPGRGATDRAVSSTSVLVLTSRDVWAPTRELAL